MLASVADEMMMSRGLQMSASDCVALLQRHREHVTDVLEQLSVTQWKLSLDNLSSADVTDVYSGINLVSVQSTYMINCNF